jgi:hypothetical protein
VPFIGSSSLAGLQLLQGPHDVDSFRFALIGGLERHLLAFSGWSNSSLQSFGCELLRTAAEIVAGPTRCFARSALASSTTFWWDTRGKKPNDRMERSGVSLSANWLISLSRRSPLGSATSVLILQHGVVVGRSALRRRHIQDMRTTILGDGSSGRRLRRGLRPIYRHRRTARGCIIPTSHWCVGEDDGTARYFWSGQR